MPSALQKEASRPSSDFAGLSHALQPVVDIHTGVVYGYEALLRGVEAAGHTTIQHFFDAAFASGWIIATELGLYRRAFVRLRHVSATARPKLFLNVDGRLMDDPNFDPQSIIDLAEEIGVECSSIVLELSERHKIATADRSCAIVQTLRGAGFRIALDDFGQGFSELKLLYAFAPEYVKIDRFFVSGIAQSQRKQLFVSTVIRLAHVLGALVIAEGVEAEDDLLACRSLGCDFVQGYFVSRPIGEPAMLEAVYGQVRAAPAKAEGPASDAALILSEMRAVEPLSEDASLGDVFERFRASPDETMFPVVDARGEPRGLIHERDFRGYIYNRFGRDILTNRSFGKHLRNFMARCPIVDKHTEIEKILETFAGTNATDGVIVTENLKYVGLLSSVALLKIINDKRLTAAQDQNPLSRLPGNASISAYVAKTAAAPGATRVLCYFDFDHFKPFNDTYGFRQGDRAIGLFADILREHFTLPDAFLGHVGGDDFFTGARTGDVTAVESAATTVLAAFRSGVESFYEPADRKAGFIRAVDREGRQRQFPLMTCSVAILIIPETETIDDFEQVSRQIAEGKRAAKCAPDGIARRFLHGSEIGAAAIAFT